MAFLDKRNHAFYLISDPFSFFPVYYCLRGSKILASTSAALFPIVADFDINQDWLYEYVFFSYPIKQTAIWKDVFRMPPATVLRFDIRSRSASLMRYGKKFAREYRMLRGEDALAHAFEVFDETMPKYFEFEADFAVALSGGYDTRTVLSFVPAERESQALTYTYGRHGSHDIIIAREISQKLGLRHLEIFFDESYEARLPELIEETVWISGGLENINRAYLPFTYKTIAASGARMQFAFSGIAADVLFRGHASTPNGLSYDIDRSYRLGRLDIDIEFFKSLFGKRFDEFYSCIEKDINSIIEDYGPFSSLDSCFAYETYELLPKYFTGELQIANNFISFRIPFVDPSVVRLTCEIEEGFFAHCKFVRHDKCKEGWLQASLLARHPRLSKIKLEGLPLAAFTSKNKALYNIIRIAYKGPKKIASSLHGKKSVPLENWPMWYKTVLKSKLDKRLSSDSRIAKYVSVDFISAMREKEEIHWLKILATLDIALELAENRWKRPNA